MAGLTGLHVALDGGGTGTDPRDGRHAMGAELESNGASPLEVRLGVIADTLAPVVTGTAGMSYDIRAFRAVTALSVANGPTVSTNDAPVNRTTTVAPGANSRIDLIYCRQHLFTGDGGVGADPDNDFVFAVKQGLPGAVPVAPSVDPGELALAYVTVPAGTLATNTLTFTRAHQWTVARGGVIPVQNANDLATITAPRKGQVIFDETLSPGRLFVWDGSIWRQVGASAEAFQAAVIGSNVAVGTGGNTISGTITVPARPYPRSVVLTGAFLCTAVPGGGNYVEARLNRSSTGTMLTASRLLAINETSPLSAVDTLAAGVGATYNLTAFTAPAGAATVVGNDAGRTFLHANVSAQRA